MIITTQIIVLRCVDFQESSKIVTALSEKHGKIALIAKGARKPKNKLTGVIEVGNILEVIYYYKPTRNVHTMTEASVIYHSPEFRKDFDKAAVMFASLEVISQLTHENERNPELFGLTERVIRWLGESVSAGMEVFPYIQVRLAKLAGFGLIDECENQNETAYLNVSNGSISNLPDTELSYKLTEGQARYLLQTLYTRRNEIFNLGLEKGELKQLIHHLDVYFKYHIDGFKERRSDSIFEQMM